LLVVRSRDRPARGPLFNSQGERRPTWQAKRNFGSIFRFLYLLAPHFPHGDEAGPSHFRNDPTTGSKRVAVLTIERIATGDPR
jgi:hypothetical protein